MSRGVLQSILALPFSRRQTQLAKVRAPLSEDEFATRISDDGGDREAAIFVYRKLSEWVYTKGFTPYPDDSLGRIYGIAEEELDEDLILEAFNALAVVPPGEEQLKAFGPVDTPLQVAKLIAQARTEATTR